MSDANGAATEALATVQLADSAGPAAEASAAASRTVFPYSASFGRIRISTLLLAADGGKSLVGETLRIGGWVKTGREAGAGAFAFVEVNDGSCFDSLQILVDRAVAERDAGGGGLRRLVATGAAVLIEGELTETPPGTRQAVELKARRVLHVGACDAAAYPIAKKRTTVEFLREKAHLRPRTNLIGAVARVRSALAAATHEFFQQQGFLYVTSPIITASDCEGAGEMFQVTTLLSKERELREAQRPPPASEELARLRDAAAEQGVRVKDAKAAAAADKADAHLAAAVKAELDKLLAAKNALAEAEEAARWTGGLRRVVPNGDVDYARDFFGRPAYLTVSGQLQGEYYACALGAVYTFGPTFRAENSHTSRHLAEFWMVEPEIAFAQLDDAVRCAEDYVRHCCRAVLARCGPDLDFLARHVDAAAPERLRAVAGANFARCTYTRAIELLQQAVAEGKKKFEDSDIRWGIDLATEHERYLAEEHFGGPVVVTDYPKDIKAFYMRVNDDGRTVAAMDLLVPRVGELVGGSQREEREDVLRQRLAELGVAVDDAYLDLRRFGTVPHAGFGLGFERLVQFVTGVDNIRDTIPFPRWPGNCGY